MNISTSSPASGPTQVGGSLIWLHGSFMFNWCIFMAFCILVHIIVLLFMLEVAEYRNSNDWLDYFGAS